MPPVGCFFVASEVKRGWSDDLWSRRAVGLHFFGLGSSPGYSCTGLGASMRGHEASNLRLLGVFLRLLLPSLFLHHVSTGLLVVASPWRPILVLQKSSFLSCLHVFYGRAKNKVRESSAWLASVCQQSCGITLVTLWRGSGIARFPGPAYFGLAGRLRCHQTFSEDIFCEIMALAAPSTFASWISWSIAVGVTGILGRQDMISARRDCSGSDAVNWFFLRKIFAVARGRYA